MSYGSDHGMTSFTAVFRESSQELESLGNDSTKDRRERRTDDKQSSRSAAKSTSSRSGGDDKRRGDERRRRDDRRDDARYADDRDGRTSTRRGAAMRQDSENERDADQNNPWAPQPSRTSKFILRCNNTAYCCCNSTRTFRMHVVHA